MELIQSEDNVPVEAEPRYVHETATMPVERTEHGQTWVRLIASILGALILIVLIVLLARWIYHASHSKAVPTPAASQNTPAKSAANSNNTAQPAPNAANPSARPGTSAGTVTPNGPQITNTGPGNTAAIFVGASLAAAGLHYIISVRRFSKNA